MNAAPHRTAECGTAAPGCESSTAAPGCVGLTGTGTRRAAAATSRLAALLAVGLFAVLLAALYYNACQVQREMFGFAGGGSPSNDAAASRGSP
ncbi:MAG: hypothetical protein CHACPFDD_03414 [Phycisphaerae bacterium]|nr:hypothetical protein [Phycisphaerae bacterium]